MRYSMIAYLMVLVIFGGSSMVQCQAPAVEFSASVKQERLILGEPWTLDFTLRWNQAVTLPMAPCGADPDLWTDLERPDGSTQSWVNGLPPLPLPRRKPLDVEAKCPLSGGATVPLCAPGQYRVRLRYKVDESWPGREAFWNGEAVSNWVAVTILEPSGVDSSVWRAFHEVAPKGDCRQFIDWMFDGTKLQSRFPTSIYTGHTLALTAPSQSLALGSFSCLSDPDGSLRKFSDMGGGEENIRLRIAKDQADMRIYAKSAESFLQAHPDFVHAPLIRKMYAMCLGLTGHIPEAMAEIRVLANGTGKEAEEAKAFLAARAQSETKSAPPPQPVPAPAVAPPPPASPTPAR